MASNGWLDIHGHFFLPFGGEEQKAALVKEMHSLCFMMEKDWSWMIDDTLAYHDKAGIQMQMLSYQPASITKLREANAYGAELVKQHPTRFGFLCALPTEDPNACLQEIERAQTGLHADGFAVSAVRNDVPLSDPRLGPVWQKLDSIGAVVWSHPDAYCGPTNGRPSPLIEVAIETARIVVDMVYRKIFLRYPNVKFVFAHCAGVLPILSGRLQLLGAEGWVPNPNNVTREEIKEQLGMIYVDTAATAATGMQPAVKMVGEQHVIYGSDCGVPCSTEETLELNRKAVMDVEKELGIKIGTVGANGWRLFPAAAKRVQTGQGNCVTDRK